MEGWFWRVTHAASGTVVVVLTALNRRADGHRWGTLGLAVHPGGFSRTALAPDAQAGPRGELRFGDALATDARAVRLDLGGDARVELELLAGMPWPRRVFGGIGPAQAIPGLTQYWHPWLLHGRVRGRAVVAGRTIDLDGADVYAEKNWAPRGGFPDAWWWGQAHGFDREDVCVAFAGGRAGLGPLRTTATSLVVAAGGRVLRLVRPLQPLRVAVGDGRWLLRGRTASGTRVEVEGHADGATAHRLPVPLPEEGRHHPHAAHQLLAGELRVALTRRGRTLYAGTSALAGLERGKGRPG
jgi:hypothetical protein